MLRVSNQLITLLWIVTIFTSAVALAESSKDNFIHSKGGVIETITFECGYANPRLHSPVIISASPLNINDDDVETLSVNLSISA